MKKIAHIPKDAIPVKYDEALQYYGGIVIEDEDGERIYYADHPESGGLDELQCLNNCVVYIYPKCDPAPLELEASVDEYPPLQGEMPLKITKDLQKRLWYYYHNELSEERQLHIIDALYEAGRPKEGYIPYYSSQDLDIDHLLTCDPCWFPMGALKIILGGMKCQ